MREQLFWRRWPETPSQVVRERRLHLLLCRRYTFICSIWNGRVDSVLYTEHYALYDFRLWTFKKDIRSPNSCKIIAHHRLEGMMVENGFGKKIVERVDENLTGEGVILKRDVIKVLWKQVSYVSKEKDIMFRIHDELKKGLWKNDAMDKPFLKGPTRPCDRQSWELKMVKCFVLNALRNGQIVCRGG